MTAGIPAGPCRGYQDAGGDLGSNRRVHCPGCAESASLRERLAISESARDELRLLAVERTAQVAKGDHDVMRAISQRNDLRARLATAEALALANGEARERAEADVERLNAFINGNEDLDALRAERDELRAALEKLRVIAHDNRDWGSRTIAENALASRAAAIPEGAPGEGTGRL